MIEAILFDVDNTLIDFFKLKKIACEHAIEAMIDAGLDAPSDEALSLLYNLYDMNGWEDQRIFQKLLSSIEGYVDHKKLSYGILAYRKARVGMLAPYPGTKPTLMELRRMGIKLGIVSDAPELQGWLRLAATGLDDLFDLILIGSTPHKGTGKPFEKALLQLNMPASHVIHVGDWPQRDIEGARKHGIRTCFAQYGRPDLHAEATYVIKSIRELLDIVAEENCATCSLAQGEAF
ncbi:MAG: HAD-IA family hydrolase [Nanoarchaeota archaeon]